MVDEIVTDAPEGDNSNDDTETALEAPEVDAPAVDGGEGVEVEAEAEAKEVVPDWPDDWRDKLAKGDEKVRKRLDRFQSPADILKSWQSLEQKFYSGDVKSKLPDDATEDQIAAYRKENGIPDKPEGYLENLPNGLVIGDEDKPLVESYIERVHGKNADPAVVQETLDWYYQIQEDQMAQQAQSDEEVRQKFDDELRAEWGGEYRSNISAIKNFLSQAPDADDGTPLKDLILDSRLSDGTPAGSHPTMLRWLARLASEANPAGFVAPGAGLSQAQGVKDEIAEIEKVMREDRTAYNKDTKMQERLRVLYDAEAKLSA